MVTILGNVASLAPRMAPPPVISLTILFHKDNPTQHTERLILDSIFCMLQNEHSQSQPIYSINFGMEIFFAASVAMDSNWETSLKHFRSLNL